MYVLYIVGGVLSVRADIGVRFVYCLLNRCCNILLGGGGGRGGV